MKVIITGREALDKGVWIALCELLGWNEWAINEGQMEETEDIILTEDEARKLRLIK